MRKIIEWGVALVLLGAAVCSDLRSMRVPNRLIAAGILLGVLLRLTGSGTEDVLHIIADLVSPVLLLYPVYLVRGLGAGDVKLFAFVSVTVGFRLTLQIIIYSFIIGSAIGIGRWILRGQMRYRLNNIRYGIRDVLFYKQGSAYFSTMEKEKLHFTVCILLAAAGCMVKEGVM